MAKKLTILFIPISAVGHINSSVGIAEVLQSRGHRIIFAADQSFKGRFIQRGFEEEIIEKELTEEEKRDPSAYFLKFIKQNKLLDDVSPLEKFKCMTGNHLKAYSRKEDQIINEIINRIKPDVIAVDFMFFPSIIKSGIPWVNINSIQILTVIDDPRTPPPCLGLPSDENMNNIIQWQYYRDLIKDDILASKMNNHYYLFEEEGIKHPFPDDKLIESPYLNLYAYPKELDYINQRPLPPKWHRFDSFVRLNEESFEIPEKLAQKTGKFIFLSLGSLGSVNIDLMKRLLHLISDLPFRFIISKGILADKYDVPNNCWGDKMVPQTKVLPKVDLVITHGGNNTVIESFYFGKPMIVMPLYVDQFDNAQRIHEKGFGIRLNAHRCTKDQLTNAINKLIFDEELALKMKKISDRMQAEVKLGKVAELIEQLIN